MGLRYLDLEAWQRWQDSRRRLRVLKHRLLSRGNAQPPGQEIRFWIRGARPRLLVACDSNSPTNAHSLLAPLNADPSVAAVIAVPPDVSLRLPAGQWREAADVGEVLAAVTTVATIGDHLPAGAWAHAEARRRGWRQVVVQHGLLTPFSPPPPPGAEWLAWSEQDAEFVAEERPDLTTRVVGSAMLASAAAQPAEHVSRFETPVFLGQLHGAELPRWAMARSVNDFWRQTGAVYRPHPREEDRLSRAQHALWRRAGMEFDLSPGLSSLSRPVVSAFSTGVLEAAARGIPSWVFHVNPPVWLEEVWTRYGMQRWGDPPTSSYNPGGSPARVLDMLIEGGTP